MKDGQDMFVTDSWGNEPTTIPLLNVGMKVSILSTQNGWALLSTMPITVRNQLINSMDNHGYREWSLLRNHAEKGIMQIHVRGFYSSAGESDAEIGIITSPLNLQGSEPFVITLMALTSELTKAKVEREISPDLVSVIHPLQTLQGMKMMKMLKQKRLERT